MRRAHLGTVSLERVAGKGGCTRRFCELRRIRGAQFSVRGQISWIVAYRCWDITGDVLTEKCGIGSASRKIMLVEGSNSF